MTNTGNGNGLLEATILETGARMQSRSKTSSRKDKTTLLFIVNGKKKEFIRKAKIVNSYKRLLKKEGKESTVSDTKVKEKHKGKAESKTDRFFKEKEKARLREEKQREREAQSLEMEKNKVRNQKRRKVMSKKLSKRTRKGQPIMKNLLGNLLDQIEKQG